MINKGGNLLKLELIKNMGFRWTVYRAQYEIKKKFGYLEKAYKPVNLDSINIGKDINKSIISNSLSKNLSKLAVENSISNNDLEQLRERTEKIFNSEFKYFGDKTFEFKGWNYSPKTKEYASKDKHWSKISDLNSDFGDIKWIWELNRFGFSYDLARMYIYTKESIYVEKFWELFDDFLKENPLEIGVNYKCSQEMSFRTNAWMFTLYHFINHPASTDDRVLRMIKCIAHYGDHIHKHINFSVESVKNNHSISEATTLTIIGNTFDFLPHAEKLFNKGYKVLEKEINWQIKEDGTFIQHSHNYHRLVFQNLSWHFVSMFSVNKRISKKILSKSNKSINYFKNVITDYGRVPNYGMNDGSYIMPLTERDYNDYRPVLQCINYQLNTTLLFKDENVNETLLLLNKLADLTHTKVEEYIVPTFTINKDGGYHTISYGRFKVHVKSKTYKERPVQADMNHIDIWYDNQCLFGDAGTYSYNDADSVLNYFNGTSSHNTVLINDENQMIKGSRFIWFNWSKSKSTIVTEHEDSIEIQVELINYNEYNHRRKIILYSNKVVIEDTVINKSTQNTDIKVQWLTPLNTYLTENNNVSINNDIWKLSLLSDLDHNTRIYYGNDESEFRGWISSTYGEKHPANQIVFNMKSNAAEIKVKTIITKE